MPRNRRPFQRRATVNRQQISVDGISRTQLGHLGCIAVAAGKPQVDDFGHTAGGGRPCRKDRLNIGIDARMRARTDFNRVRPPSPDDQRFIAAEQLCARGGKMGQDNFEILIGKAGDLHITVGHDGGTQPGDGLHVVRNDPVIATVKPFDAFDPDMLLPEYLNFRAHGAQHVDQVEDFGPYMRVPHTRDTLSKRCAQDGVFSRPGRTHRQMDISAEETIFCLRAKIVPFFPHAGTKLFEDVDMNVVFPLAELAPARQRHAALAVSRKQAAEDQQGVADRAFRPVEAHRRSVDLADRDGFLVLQIGLLAKPFQHSDVNLCIEQLGGIVRELHFFARQQAGRQQPQGAVLRASQFDPTFAGPPIHRDRQPVCIFADARYSGHFGASSMIVASAERLEAL